MRHIVASPARSVCDHYARALNSRQMLGAYALGTRRGVEGVRQEKTLLFPLIGLLNFAACQILNPYQAESFRFRLGDLFDRWLRSRLRPGDVLISAPGYVAASAAWLRQNQGVVLLDCGNSHPENFWSLLEEEHRIWKVKTPPIAPHHITRCLRAIASCNFIFSPSSFVTDSYLRRGFPARNILPTIYPVDLARFQPGARRPASRPFTIINTGSLSLRKGTPYLLEALRLIKKDVPEVRILLTRAISDSVASIIPRYADLNIEWAPSLPHQQLADRLREADLYILPSLEEGLARTALEALACGLPTIVTAHTGVNDYIREGINGSVVPLRDPGAIAGAALAWWQRIQAGNVIGGAAFIDREHFSQENFERLFMGHLERLKLLPP